jgi:hypothetical protein
VLGALGLTKADIAEGPLPECAIGAVGLALLEAKQFVPQIARSVSFADPFAPKPYIYGDFYTDAKGKKLRVSTSTKLLIDLNCNFHYVGYQAGPGTSTSPPSLYIPYLEKLLAVLLDQHPDLKPKKAHSGTGYDGIAYIPVEFVMQVMTGRQGKMTSHSKTILVLSWMKKC